MGISRNLVLGIEGGGTKTDWIYVSTDEESHKVLKQGCLSQANLKLTSDQSLHHIFSVLPGDASHVGVFLAGCSTEGDKARLEAVARSVWPRARLAIGSDRDSGFATAFAGGDGIVVIAGTGSAVTGRKNGQVSKAGGWGHLLGDRGGGYDLGVQALRIALWNLDVDHSVSPIGEKLLQALALNRLEELADWAQNADKMSVARLAPVAFSAAKQGDAEMIAAIQTGARVLADYTRAVAAHLQFAEPEVKLLGGLFVHHAEYFDLYKDYLSDLLPGALVSLCAESGANGAAWLASRDISFEPPRIPVQIETDGKELAAAATEQPNPRSAGMDTLSTAELVDLFISEEGMVMEALAQCSERLIDAVNLVSDCLKNGGRLFYAGAGTSGRLGVLDATELPPTFGVPADLVQGIMAGGMAALHSAVEGAEDQAELGALSVLGRGVGPADVVCGISASGRAPFVLGALEKAAELQAKTVLLTCNPSRRHARSWDVEIDIPTGPELLTGSTRLKAGTATKIALNILSTSAMIRLGRVKGNLMIDVNASNSKLRDRAIRLVSSLKNCSPEEARAALEDNGWNVRACL